MYKEIGSNFWLNRNKDSEDKQVNLNHLQINTADIAFLSTGRGSIAFVLDHIKLPENKKVALLPPFTCHTVIEPFINAGYKVFYYRVNRDLSCNKKSFLKDIEKIKPAVVLVHGYFGFNTLSLIKDAILEIKEKGIVVIEDITQTIYSKFEYSQADYYVCSFRKWTALPDGGCAISSKEPFKYKPVEIDIKLQEAKLEAFHAKHLYINEDTGIKDDFLRKFYDAEQILCEQKSIYAMSRISKKLQGNLDINLLRVKRRKNYSILLEKLQDSNSVKPVFRELPDEVTPLYFVVYARCNRKELQNYLAKNDIYAPVVWPKPYQCNNAVNEEADWIYQHILAIPCDQRYDIDDMKRITTTLNDFEFKRMKRKKAIS